jgi:hypothetical protein
MEQRRAAVRNQAYASAIAIAQAAMPEGGVAAAFEGSFAGGDTRLDRINHPTSEGECRSVKDTPDGDGGITDIANIDAGYAAVYAGLIGEAATAEARVDDFVVRRATSLWHGASRTGLQPVRAAANTRGQLSSRLPFVSASLAERSTRSSRSGISWFRRSSPSSRSASSSSASRFLGVGQTFGFVLWS